MRTRYAACGFFDDKIVGRYVRKGWPDESDYVVFMTNVKNQTLQELEANADEIPEKIRVQADKAQGYYLSQVEWPI